MLSEIRGAVTEIQKEATNAVKTPCYSHKLNNSISHSSKVPPIRDAVSVMKEVIAFFKSHPKRRTVLMNTLGCALKSLCETRWVERHEGVLQFSMDLAKIVETLEKISEWHDPSTAGKAASLVTTLTNQQFIVSVLCLSDVLSVTQSLSKILQKTVLDLNDSAIQVNNTISILASRRENIDTSFNSVWQRAKDIAEQLGVELNVPRIPRGGGRQIYRANHQTNSAEEYYRVAIYVPLLDYVLTDLRQRFSTETLDTFHLTVLIPENIIKNSPEEDVKSIQFLLERFGRLLDLDRGVASQLLKDEMLLWRVKWKQHKEREQELPATAVDILAGCNKDAFPIVYNFICILATLPVTNASAERSFSSLRRLKTYLRATMKETRLLGLALMHIHRHIPIDVEEVITKFAKSNRKLEFNI
ncbi:zinc finger MYM-type protein 1-like [Cydia pomonella]|uniref:zinc finger MYM-type protein 1-like n=1 Tax=Cydia pomonella TaxID=82600 RepID=UPI002ADE2C13|nr:zinc finger MYM-type protein 1-like [Cydia pomonella]